MIGMSGVIFILCGVAVWLWTAETGAGLTREQSVGALSYEWPQGDLPTVNTAVPDGVVRSHKHFFRY